MSQMEVPTTAQAATEGRATTLTRNRAGEETDRKESDRSGGGRGGGRATRASLTTPTNAAAAAAAGVEGDGGGSSSRSPQSRRVRKKPGGETRVSRYWRRVNQPTAVTTTNASGGGGGGGDDTDTSSFGDVPTKLLGPPPTAGGGGREKEGDVVLEKCTLCEGPMYYMGIGKCPDRLCWVCVVRLRLLRETVKCPYCSDTLPQVLITNSAIPFLAIDFDNYIKGPNGLYYLNSEVRAAVESLMQMRCWLPQCEGREVFQSREQFDKHFRERHGGRVFCDVCVETRRKYAFWWEMKLVQVQELPAHRVRGSATTAPHVFCYVCNKWMFDELEFYTHYHQEHMFCRLCDQDGLHAFFKDYDNLYKHFEAKHHPCPEKEACVDVVFRTDFDLRVHMAKKHPEQLRLLTGAAANRRRGIKLDIFQSSSSTSSRQSRRGEGGGGGGGTEGTSMSSSSTTTSQMGGGGGGRSDGDSMMEDQFQRTIARWPLPMIQQAENLYELLMDHNQNSESAQTASNKLCLKALKDFCESKDCVRIKEELQMLSGGSNSPEEALGRVAFLLHSRELELQRGGRLTEPIKDWASWREGTFQVVDAFASGRHDGNSYREVHLSPAAEVLFRIILGAPKSIRAELINVIRRVSLCPTPKIPEVGVVVKSTNNSTNESSSGATSFEQPTAEEKGILVSASLSHLPIGPKVPFIEALQWALVEYDRILASEDEDDPIEDNVPDRLPEEIIDRIKFEYIRPDIEQLVHLVVDLSDYIPTKALESILALRPWYHNYKNRARLIQTQTTVNGIARNVTKPSDLSYDWARECDRTFKYLESRKQTDLLKEYIELSRRHASTATFEYRPILSGKSSPGQKNTTEYPSLASSSGHDTSSWPRKRTAMTPPSWGPPGLCKQSEELFPPLADPSEASPAVAGLLGSSRQVASKKSVAASCSWCGAPVPPGLLLVSAGRPAANVKELLCDQCSKTKQRLTSSSGGSSIATSSSRGDWRVIEEPNFSSHSTTSGSTSRVITTSSVIRPNRAEFGDNRKATAEIDFPPIGGTLTTSQKSPSNPTWGPNRNVDEQQLITVRPKQSAMKKKKKNDLREMAIKRG